MISAHEGSEMYIVKRTEGHTDSPHPVSGGVGQNCLCHSIAVVLPTQLLRSRLHSYSQGQAATMTHHPVNTRHVRWKKTTDYLIRWTFIMRSVSVKILIITTTVVKRQQMGTLMTLKHTM